MATAAALYPLRAGAEPRRGGPRPAAEATRDRRAPNASTRPSAGKRPRADAAALDVPDERMQFLYDAAVHTLVLLSADDVVPGPYTYRRFWFRDACLMMNALLALGLHDRVPPGASSASPRGRLRNGYFRSQEGEWDSNGAGAVDPRPLRRAHRRAAARRAARRRRRAACAGSMRKRLPDDARRPARRPAAGRASAPSTSGPTTTTTGTTSGREAGLRAAAGLLRRAGRRQRRRRRRAGGRRPAAADRPQPRSASRPPRSLGGIPGVALPPDRRRRHRLARRRLPAAALPARGDRALMATVEFLLRQLLPSTADSSRT